jgi:hypothetical protein
LFPTADVFVPFPKFAKTSCEYPTFPDQKATFSGQKAPSLLCFQVIRARRILLYGTDFYENGVSLIFLHGQGQKILNIVIICMSVWWFDGNVVAP